ncbi:DUF3868 domain-containing protein [Parabacteroides sp. PF5-6]|uniref:OmpA family protein n=1 Tax=Parabacteroides sp. PF5-6 TaxID=1742403 RepID=UPI00240748B6|nr:DUF3868 domain-containing protein [Parabacteroides sp. PF5-6]MDF9830795.1 outer membrane protein OmpA-like peptidoglycan-associated protein [Parabacteroides sp. PF5-6]
MNKLYLYRSLSVFFSLFCLFSVAKSQNSYSGEIQYKDIQSFRQGEKLMIQLYMDISSINLPKQLIISQVPVIVSTEPAQEYVFDPIILTGAVRSKVYQRQKEDYLPQGKDPLLYATRKNGEKQLYPVLLTAPYAEWMRNANLIFREEVSGCAHCDLGKKEIVVADPILAPVHTPTYALQYVMPEAEPVKHRSETYAAHLNFKVGKYELLRDFENNANVLAQVDRIVSEIREDENLAIQALEIVGYASPEGNYNANLELSKNRTYAFVNYLVRFQQLSESMMKTNWKGEDWEGLRKSVLASSLPDKEAVISLIDRNEDISKRKEQLKALNGGNTYRTLLNTYYPPLRRIEYTFAYVARAFDLEEAKEVIKSKPQHLSLNEMFLVANSYAKGSEDFNRIFDIAVRLFPEDPIANLNAAVQEIEMGALDRAIERLQQIDCAEAKNNLGVAYARKGDYIQAGACFKRAAEQGNEVAASNRQELDKFLENR